jgi:PIN domain nuclease of toxin-antitoxin system
VRLLLDTHVGVWSVGGSPRLAAPVVEMIATAEVVAMSVASLWEIAIKNNLGRQASDPLNVSVIEAKEAFAAVAFEILPIEMAHMQVVEGLPIIHRDPFDRMIVAVAQSDTYRLVTHDRRLREYGGDVLLV